MKGGFGCSPCCDPCPPCEQECTNPHTGDPFEVVYTKYTLGAESGNLTDGYLTASGDNDTSDPVDGMDGTGPWSQTITGTITLGDGRFPCTTHMSFWRQSGVLGPQTPGTTPSAALTVNRITVVATSGTAQVLGPGVGVVIKAGTDSDTASVEDKIPVAAGDATDPITSGYAVRIQAVCGTTVTVQITAEIEWNVSQRQHTLYGIVRECYEEGTPCAEFCDGDPPPDVLYLTISNYTGPEPASGSPNGTYVLERFPGVCDGFIGAVPWGCRPNSLTPDSMLEGYDEARAFSKFISIGSWQIVNGECKILLLVAYDGSSVDKSYCGEGVLHSGTGLVYVHTRLFGALPEDIVPGSFDWEIST